MQVLSATTGIAGFPCLLLQVEAAGERVEQELTAALATVDDYAHSSDMRSLRPSLVYDPVNNAVWIKLPKGSNVRCLPAHCISFHSMFAHRFMVCRQ